MQNNRDKGTVIGGVAGAAIGAQFGRGQGQVITGAAGAILGALIGSKIGESMDEVDRMKMARSTQSALEHNKQIRRQPGEIGQEPYW